MPSTCVEDPVTADFVVLLEDDYIKAELDRVFCGGGAAWTGTNDTNPHFVGHSFPPRMDMVVQEVRNNSDLWEYINI